MKNSYTLSQRGKIAHQLRCAQARLRAIEVEPFIQQADAHAPAFEVPTMFQAPMEACTNLGKDQL